MKQNKYFVAITGGIGSGKTTVSEYIRLCGYEVFSADSITREMYEEAHFIERIGEFCPKCIRENRVDRKCLADFVFSDPNKLKQLNSFTHPEIKQRLFFRMNRANGSIVFAEVPLLFECGWGNEFDDVIVVLRSESTRVAAVMQRDGASQNSVQQRINNQINYENFTEIGHTILYNDGDLCSLYTKLDRLLYDYSLRITK